MVRIIGLSSVREERGHLRRGALSGQRRDTTQETRKWSFYFAQSANIGVEKLDLVNAKSEIKFPAKVDLSGFPGGLNERVQQTNGFNRGQHGRISALDGVASTVWLPTFRIKVRR
jgi:hypothetical protein